MMRAGYQEVGPPAPSGHQSDEDDDEEDVALGVRKERFPKAKKRTAATPIFDEERGGYVKGKDPRAAVSERASRRKNVVENEMGMLNDVADAEEDYEEEMDELGLVEDEEGAKMEPFNLRKEREEGYFDAEGNFVEYQRELEGRDAWLETATVDRRFADRRAALGDDDSGDDEDEQEERELTSDELAVIKRRIAGALLPGETVQKALQRLGGGARKGGGALGSQRDKGRGSGAGSMVRMSEADKRLFDSLTEDACKLMEQGEYNVYFEKKETFVREAEGYEAIARVRAGPSNQPPAPSFAGTGPGTVTGGAASLDDRGSGPPGSKPGVASEEDSAGLGSGDGVEAARGSKAGPSHLASSADDMFAEDDDDANQGTGGSVNEILTGNANQGASGRGTEPPGKGAGAPERGTGLSERISGLPLVSQGLAGAAGVHTDAGGGGASRIGTVAEGGSGAGKGTEKGGGAGEERRGGKRRRGTEEEAGGGLQARSAGDAEVDEKATGGGVPAEAWGVPAEESGYVWDESSGYYFNQELGYYYDANCGLYCSGTTGQWYSFDSASSTYTEFKGEKAEAV